MTNTKSKCTVCGATFDPSSQPGCPSCQMKLGLSGNSATSEMQFMSPDELSQKFDDLDVIELIGAGGMGAVYKVKQKKLDRIVALKVVKADISDSAEFSQRFEREAKAMARLNHPNIVSIYDFGITDGLFYYVMEFVDGPDLGELAKSEDLTSMESLEIVTQVCKAMQYAHENGVVHRDIKPTNILLNSDGVVKIADFGLAKLCAPNDPTTHLTQTHQIFGTPRYMAPEQIEATREVDHRADIYSLGVVFYELLTGELPLGRFDPPSQKINIDVKLDEIVLRALEKHPERRYQAARDFQTDISRFSGHQPVPPIKQHPVLAGTAGNSPISYPRPSFIFPILLIPGVLLSMFLLYVFASDSCARYFNSPLGNLSGISDSGYTILVFTAVVLLSIGVTVQYLGLPQDIKAQMAAKSPVRNIFTYRTISYFMAIIALLFVAVPWVEFGGMQATMYVFGNQMWNGTGLLIWCFVGMALLIFIDIYEGTKIHFSICLMVYGLVVLGSAVAVLVEPPITYVPKDLVIRLTTAPIPSHSAGPLVLQFVGVITFLFGLIGLIVSLVGQVGSLSGFGKRIALVLVRWRDAFIEWRRKSSIGRRRDQDQW